VSLAANVLVGLVALLHVYFLVLEMFFWDKPVGLRAFGLTPETAQASKVLAANQGLYTDSSPRVWHGDCCWATRERRSRSSSSVAC
jgi:hypothetical protein